jgi:hypothetical protein
MIEREINNMAFIDQANQIRTVNTKMTLLFINQRDILLLLLVHYIVTTSGSVSIDKFRLEILNLDKKDNYYF